MARIICWFLIITSVSAAEVRQLIRSSASSPVYATITSAGWIDKESFFSFAYTCATTLTNSKAWRDYSYYWTIIGVFTNGGIGFQIEPPNKVQVATMEWLWVVRNANQESSEVQIVVANSLAWAGSTRARIAITRNPAPQILDHELYHYWSGCGDEYAYQGIEQDADRIPNLAGSWYNAQIKWRSFIDAGVISPVEGGTGWFKPTANDCIMFDPVKDPCAVCFKTQRTTWLNYIGKTEISSLIKPKVVVRITQ